MSEDLIKNNVILPSLTYVIQNKPEMLEYYIKNFFHYSNKMINSLNFSTPICIKPNNPLKELPYISLKTLGVEDYELDYNANAGYSAPIKLFKAFYESKESFIKKINEIIEYNEKEKSKLEQNDSKIEKIDLIIQYCKKDKENIELIEKKIGKNSDFYKNVFNKHIDKELPVRSRQVLIYDEEIEDYISITPVFSLILNKKIDEEIKKMNVGENKFFINKADGSIGGNKPQNTTTYQRYADFKIFSKQPKIKDIKYKKLWSLIHNGFNVFINKNIINEFNFLIKKFENKKNIENKIKLESLSRKYINENIRLSNNMNDWISQIIIEDLKDELNIVFNQQDLLIHILNNKDLPDFYQDLLINFKNTPKHLWLFKNKDENKEILSQDLINKLKSLIIKNQNISNETEKVIVKIFNEELAK